MMSEKQVKELKKELKGFRKEATDCMDIIAFDYGIDILDIILDHK